MSLPDFKKPVTLLLNANVWYLYSKACKDAALIPSHEVEAFMRRRLKALLHHPTPQKETDHA